MQSKYCKEINANKSGRIFFKCFKFYPSLRFEVALGRGLLIRKLRNR